MKSKSKEKSGKADANRSYLTDPTLILVAEANSFLSALRSSAKKMHKSLVKESRLRKRFSPQEIRAYRAHKRDAAVREMTPFLRVPSSEEEKTLAKAYHAYLRMVSEKAAKGGK
jgi:hypothetical protein